jgi:SNF2 family DNA or RNA helicase
MTEETFGDIELNAGWITLRSDPFVRMKVMRLFPGMKDDGKGTLRIKATESNAEDIAWMLQRWPHRARPGVMSWIRATVAALKTKRAAGQNVLAGHYRLDIKTAVPLRDYQIQAVELTKSSPGLIIGDSVGLGKTATGVGIILAHPLPALVVCPTHIQKQWCDQVRKFAPQLKCHIIQKRGEYTLPEHDVTVITYSKLDAWAQRRAWHTVIYDEGHELRGEDTEKGRAAIFIAEVAKVRVILTATAVFNYAGQLFNMYRAVAPGALGTRDEFAREWKSDHKGRVADPVALGQWLRSQFLYLRRTREEVGRELPPEEIIHHIVEHDPKIMDTMRALGRELAAKVLEGTFTEKGIAARELDARLRQVTGLAKAPAVAEFVTELAQNNEPVLLAGWHREVFNVWRSKFDEAGIRYGMYTGTENASQKALAAAKFIERELDVLIISLRAGEGLDGLQTVCKTVVIGEPDWSPARHLQLIGRARRDGMDMNSRVTAFFLMSESGSDPIMAQVLGAKWKSATAVTDPDKLNPDEDFTQAEEESRIAMLARDWLSRTR